MKTITKDLHTGAIDYIYESDTFWEHKEEYIDSLDLNYCYKQLTRYVLKNDLDINDDWDEIMDEAYNILSDEYEFTKQQL